MQTAYCVANKWNDVINLESIWTLPAEFSVELATLSVHITYLISFKPRGNCSQQTLLTHTLVQLAADTVAFSPQLSVLPCVS